MKPHKRSLPPDKPATTKVRTFEHSDPSESSGQQQSSGTATTSASSEQTGVPVPQQAGRRVTTTASNEQTSVPLSQQATNRVNMKPQKRSLPPEKSASTKVRTFEHDDTSDNRVQPQSSGTGTTTASNEETGVPVSQQASSSGTTMTPSQQTSDPVSRQTTGGVSAMTRVQQTSVTVSQQATSSMTKKSHKRSLSSEIYHSRKHRKCEHSKTPDSHVQEKATSSGKTTASNQHSGIPVSQQTTSIGTTMTPSQQTAVPVSQQAINSGTTMTPSQQTVVPPSQQTTSSDITTTPSQQTAIPASQQATISGTMMTPSQKTVVSVSQQTTSSGTTMTPSQQTGGSLSQQATSSSATMTPSQQTGASVSQQTTSNGTTMTPSQQTGGSVSQQATSRGITMTPSQQTGASVSQQASCSGPSQNQTTSTLQLTPDDENYWRMVKILLGDVPTKLRQHFRSAFQGKYRIAWGDNSTSGKFFMAMVPKSKKRDKHITDTVENGVTQQFDCTTLFYCLLFSGTDLLTPVARKRELIGSPFHQSERIHQLREQRNAVAHATEPSLSVGDFRARMQEIEDIYTELQWNQTELKKAAYDPLWPTEYGRLQKEIDVEKARVDQLEHQHQKLEQRVQQTEQQQESIKQFVKNVEALRSAENEKTPGMNALQLTQNDTNFWHLKQILQEDVLEKLREVFKSAFQKKYRFAWSDNSTSGSFFMAQVPKSKKPDQHIRATLRLGTTDEFNCATLCYCLLDSGTELLRSHVRKKAVDQLLAHSNALDDANSTYVSDEDVHARLQELEHIYQGFQWDRTRLDATPQDHPSHAGCDRLKQEKLGKIVREKLTKAMRDTYSCYTFPVRYAGSADVQVTLGEMFVDLRLQMFEDSKLPEDLAYRDVEKMQKLMQSNKIIEVAQLFEVLDDKVAPDSVLIRGSPGVGKTTFIKDIAKRWAEKKVWKEFKYVFVIILRELNQTRMWNLEELLLDRLGRLSLSDVERTVAMKQFLDNPEQLIIFLEGADELRLFKYTEHFEPKHEKKVALNTLLSSIISGAVLPGAKVAITSRPTDQLTSNVCRRVTELCGFCEENIKKYVVKFSGTDSELQQFILGYLATNANIATFCYIPVTCNFVCMCLRSMHFSRLSESLAAVSTITQLYVYATMHLVRKLHPGLKNDIRDLDYKAIFSRVGCSLTNHAKVAKRCTMTSPLRLILYDDDIEEISADDRQSGFLDESLKTDATTVGQSQRCWCFTHLTVQEFFTALGLLMGQRDDISQLTESKDTVRKQEVLLTFVVGLLCDPRNANFLKYFRSEENEQMLQAYEPRSFLENLAAKMDSLQLVTLVHETQCPDLVDIVPAEIKARHVFPTEMTSLVWVMQQPKSPIISLDLSGFDSRLMTQLGHGLPCSSSILEVLRLTGDGGGGPLATTEAGISLGTALRTMGQLREIRLELCRLTPESLSPVLDGLRRCQHLEVFRLWGDGGGSLATTEAGISLGTTLRTMGQLREIHLVLCRLTPESLSPVLDGLRRCQHMEVFRLWFNEGCLRSTETTQRLGDCLRQQDQLRRLILWDCGLTPASLSALSTALTGGCRGLKEFNCRGNRELGRDNSDNTGDTLRGMLRHWHQLHIEARACSLSHSTVSRLRNEFEGRFSGGPVY